MARTYAQVNTKACICVLMRTYKGESDDCFQSGRHRGLGLQQAGRRSLSAKLLKLYRIAGRIMLLCEGDRKTLLYD
jgi:hypothetical protein